MSRLKEYLSRINESYPQDNEAEVKRMHNKMHKDVPNDVAEPGGRDERVPTNVEAGIKKAVIAKLDKEKDDAIIDFIAGEARKYIKDPDEADQYAVSLFDRMRGK